MKFKKKTKAFILSIFGISTTLSLVSFSPNSHVEINLNKKDLNEKNYRKFDFNNYKEPDLFKFIENNFSNFYLNENSDYLYFEENSKNNRKHYIKIDNEDKKIIYWIKDKKNQILNEGFFSIEPDVEKNDYKIKNNDKNGETIIYLSEALEHATSTKKNLFLPLAVAAAPFIPTLLGYLGIGLGATVATVATAAVIEEATSGSAFTHTPTPSEDPNDFEFKDVDGKTIKFKRFKLTNAKKLTTILAIKTTIEALNKDQYFLTFFKKIGDFKFFDIPIPYFIAKAIIISAPISNYKGIDNYKLNPAFNPLGLIDKVLNLSGLGSDYTELYYDVYTKKRENALLLAESAAKIMNTNLYEMVSSGKLKKPGEEWVVVEEGYNWRYWTQFKHFHIQKGQKLHSKDYKIRKKTHILYGDPKFNYKKEKDNLK
ncbi:hypothetical protein ACW95P_03215 [Candidatus Mycoplasma pogonae]